MAGVWPAPNLKNQLWIDNNYIKKKKEFNKYETMMNIQKTKKINAWLTLLLLLRGREENKYKDATFLFFWGKKNKKLFSGDEI